MSYHKRIAKCRKCKEPLYELITAWGVLLGIRECINWHCSNYGRTIKKRGAY